MPEEKPAEITLFAKQIVSNPLLSRKQISIEIIHTSKASISKTMIKDKLSKMFKASAECIAVFGMKFKFGGGRSTGFALIYDNIDARKACDMKHLLLRDDLLKKGKKIMRKQGKEIKGRQKRLRGTAKAKAGAGGAPGSQKKKDK